PGLALNGAGQSVGLLELDGYFASDIAAYEAFNGIPNVPLQNVLLDGFNGTPSSSSNPNWVGEVSLDIEMAIAMAPGLAQVVVFEAPNNGSSWYDILDDMAQQAPFIKQLSSSWSIGYDYATRDRYLQFAAQGQSFFQASGDNGSYYPGIAQSAESPNITIV